MEIRRNNWVLEIKTTKREHNPSSNLFVHSISLEAPFVLLYPNGSSSLVTEKSFRSVCLSFSNLIFIITWFVLRFPPGTLRKHKLVNKLANLFKWICQTPTDFLALRYDGWPLCSFLAEAFGRGFWFSQLWNKQLWVLLNNKPVI